MTPFHGFTHANTSAENINLLKIAANTLFPMSYVVIGDDDKPLKYTRKEGKPKRLIRTWRVSTTGETPKPQA